MRSSPRSISAALFLALCVTQAGCAHYYLPSNQLETPEALGPERIGRLELVAIQSGSDLIATPTHQNADPVTGVTPDPVLQLAPINYFFGATFSVTSRLDLGVRFEPYAPLMVRGKYQLYGDSESQAQAGNFAISASFCTGLLLSTYNGNGVTFYLANAAMIGGYRFATHHLVSLAPFFSMAGLSGVYASSITSTRFGGSLGYQYDIEALILRAEITYALGSVALPTDPANAGGIFPGVLLGLKL